MSTRARQGLVLMVVGLLVLPGTAVGVVRGSPDLSVSTAENTFTPGANDRLEVTVTNEGDLDVGSTRDPSLNRVVTTARGVDVTLEADDTPVDVTTGTRTLGSLPQGEAASPGYELSVDEDAKPGTYTLEATVEYQHTSTVSEATGARNGRTRTRHFEVTIEIEDRARFEVVSAGTDARVGSSGTVTVEMRNVGSEAANDTSVALESMNADVTFGGSTSASRYAGDWQPGETRTLRYQAAIADAAEPQRYTVQATATFEDAEGVTRSSGTLSTGVEPIAKQQFRVVSSESNVAVGDTGTVSVTLENAGSIPVSSATVRAQSESDTLAFGDSASASRFVGDWAPGETRTVVYDVTAADDAEIRSYALTTSVSYHDPDGDPASSRSLPLGVTPEPEREFGLSNTSSTLRVGEEGSVRGTITNEGDTVARNVVVRLTSQNQNLSPLGRSHSVGDLAPGESATVEFTAEVSEAADTGPRQFSFVADYRTRDGEPRTSDELLTRLRVADGGQAFAVEAVEATYEPGGSGALTVRVTNTANETLTDVSANLFADDPVSVDDREAFVPELGAGESATVTFEVAAGSDALTKSYPVSVDFQYEDGDGDTHVSTSHQVSVTVTEPDSNGGSGGPPLSLVGVGAVAVVGVGVVLRRRR